MPEWTYTLTFAPSWKHTKIILKHFLKKDINLQGQQQNFGKIENRCTKSNKIQLMQKRQSPNPRKKSDF